MLQDDACLHVTHTGQDMLCFMCRKEVNYSLYCLIICHLTSKAVVVQWFQQQPRDFCALRTYWLMLNWNSCLSICGDYFQHPPLL